MSSKMFLLVWLIVAFYVFLGVPRIFKWMMVNNIGLKKYVVSYRDFQASEREINTICGLRLPLAAGGIYVSIGLARIALSNEYFFIAPSLKLLSFVIPTWMIPFSEIGEIKSQNNSQFKALLLDKAGKTIVSVMIFNRDAFLIMCQSRLT